jgi:vancomycin resistance protein VanJ
MRNRLRRWANTAASLASVGYPVGLILVWLVLRFVGEAWWISGVGLLLPPWGFALPLPFLVLWLVLARRWRLLLLQLVSSVVLLFPLMGLTLSLPAAPAPGAPRLRVLSYNVNSGYGGFPEVGSEILAPGADVVFLEELPEWRAEPVLLQLREKYPFVYAKGEFVVASRFPILAAELPERLPFYGDLRSPRFVRFVIQTPLGDIAFFLIHTISPRAGLYALRGQGLKKELVSGRLLLGENADGVQNLSGLKLLQVAALAKLAEKEKGRVVILGDTNLPTLSPARHKYLGHYQDGFARAGNGFGYTFPSKLPWMRIDLVLANEQLRFTHFEVGKGRASDHRCVVADLVNR